MYNQLNLLLIYMSVYTTIHFQELEEFLNEYALGELITYKGISGGITNTNYFVDTTHGRYVLTIFEQLSTQNLSFYLDLTLFLNRHQVACPAPVPRINQQLFGILKNKPATLITCLNGAETQNPNQTQCINVGSMLAKMHLKSIHFPDKMINPRYQIWWNETAKKLSPCLPTDDANLLNDEIKFLNQHLRHDLPNGIIHADLFKDNVLMYYDQVAGFIDFYYACNGIFIYDLAIAINDWARNSDNTLNALKENALLIGYESIRTLTTQEKTYLPIAKRSATIRFWISRLLDFYFPMPGEMTFIKNPDIFKELLLFHRQTPIE